MNDKILDNVLRREGGYVDRADDRGGPTNYGITMPRLTAWRRRAVTAADIRELTQLEARAIYQADLEDYGFNGIDAEPLRDLVFDCAVNHGPARAVKWLQRALGVPEDGKIGPVTIAALEAAFPWAVYCAVLAERIRFYGRLISKDASDADRDGISDAGENASGWLNRCAEFVERHE